MNIKVDVEMTPEELRRLMGLPDVQEFNREVMAQMIKKVQDGTDGFEALNFFKNSIVTGSEAVKPWMDFFTGGKKSP